MTQNHHPRPPPPPDLPKVPKFLLNEKRNKQNYIPKVVSIGPYHHGKSDLQLAESFKPMAAKMVVSEKENFYHQEIIKEISKIKKCYEQEYISSYSDDELTRMMLLDACFIIVHIETSLMDGTPKSDHETMVSGNATFMFHTLGMWSMSAVLRDMFLLENQIPLWIVKLLLNSRYTKDDESEQLLNRYMTRSLFGEFRSNIVKPPENEEVHLLQAFHRLVVHGFVAQPEKPSLSFISCKFFNCCKPHTKKSIGADSNMDPESGRSSKEKSTTMFKSCMNAFAPRALKKLLENKKVEGDLKKFVHAFRSVTDLKTAGIRFRPSQTLSLQDVKFQSHFLGGKLRLPIWGVSVYTKVFFLNMIAYELRPNNLNRLIFTSYINLMKSLIAKPEDVKELREKMILYCTFGSDGQILKVYQDINTYGANNPSVFQEVKDKIQAHCNNKLKIWIAEFLHEHFHTPWSIMALFAAICILVLTFLQTVYTMKSYLKEK